jgi:hypothetical protein
MPAILLIVIIVLLVGVLPTWPHSASWGYALTHPLIFLGT